MSEVVQLKDMPPLRRWGLVPETMAEAMKLADMMAGAKLVPAALQKSPADCLMVIQQAIRWDMDPFAVAQECSVIQGKLMHSGKLVAAVVNARGNLTQRLSFEYRGDGDDRTIVVSGQLQGEQMPRTIEVALKNAKTANGMWTKQPDQQLMYHGSRVWARRHTPELMLGVYSPEEFDELPPTVRRPNPPAPNVMLPPHDPETGEIALQPAAPDWQEYTDRWGIILDEDGATAENLGNLWNSREHKNQRQAITWPDDAFDELKKRVTERIAALKRPTTPQ